VDTLKKITEIACIGGGVIGASWASYFAAKGIAVNLQDISNKFLEQAKTEIDKNLKFFVDINVLQKSELDTIAGLVHYTTDLREAVENVQLIQESIVEDYGIKQQLIKEIDTYNQTALLCSSTSGLLMTKIAEHSEFASRCITAHPFNPPHLIPLVELVKGKKTSKETVDLAYDFYKSIGKEPVRINKEIPGHLANRLQVALWRETIDLVMNGVCSLEDVDTACQYGPGLRWGIMGPNMILNLGGGEGGIARLIEHLGPAIESWWADEADWKKFPEGSTEVLVEGCKKAMHGKDIQEMEKVRDQRLIGLLKILGKM